MARQSFPTAFVAEFRGQAPGGEFNNDAGERVTYGPALKFERVKADGDVEFYTLRANPAVQQASDVQPASLKRGAKIELHGEAVLSDNGGSSYFRLHALRAVA